MGATLPFLVRFLVRQRGDLAEHIGYLYGVNTLGAAVGCALIGLLFIGLLGVIESSLVASVLYLVIAGLAGWLVWTTPAVTSDVQEPETKQSSTQGQERRVWVLMVVFSVSGFISIAYEVLWFRVLANFNLHTVYAFSAMLSTYLFGLVIGAFLCARLLSRNKDRLLEYFASLQLLIAVAGTVTLVLLGRSRDLFAAITWLKDGSGIPAETLAMFGNTIEVSLVCLVILLVPTTLIGVGFPLASELTVQRMSGLGTRIGGLYALNTAGGTLGSLAAGFVLLPLIGSQWSLTLIICLNLALFVLLVTTQPGLVGSRKLWRYGAESLAVIAVTFMIVGPNYLTTAQTQFLGGEVLAYRESRDAPFVVMGYETPQAGQFQQLIVNGRSYANNAPPGRRYMAMLAHLPVFIHPSPRTAMIACVGTGTTVGSLTTHKSLTSIHAVDLSKDVFEFAPHFEPVNHSFYTQPRVHQSAADARHHLLSGDSQYDVITFEPPPPQDAGVVNLYSQEFYQLAKSRLSEGGVVAQWIPLDLDRGVLPLMMIQAMRAEFPHVSLWISNRMEGIVVGSERSLQIDLEAWQQRMTEPSVRDDLNAIGITSAQDVATMFIAADDTLAALVGDVPSVSDNRPRIEYFNLYPVSSLRYDFLLSHAEPVDRYLVGAAQDPVVMANAHQVARSIWLQHEASVLGDDNASRQHIERALAIDPENRYLLYLQADQRR